MIAFQKILQTDGCGITHLAEPLIVEGRRKQVLDQVGHHAAASTVAHYDGRVVLERKRAGPAKQVEFISHGNLALTALLKEKGLDTGRSENRQRKHPPRKPWWRREGSAECTACRTPGIHPAFYDPAAPDR